MNDRRLKMMKSQQTHRLATTCPEEQRTHSVPTVPITGTTAMQNPPFLTWQRL